MNWALTAAGFGVGIIVGLTGMGGGALMTPVLVIFFNIPPLAAVSSDLVASAVMKPVGSLVHIKRGRVDWNLVRWLCVGSVPAAFCGVLVTKAIGGNQLQKTVQVALGIALLLAVVGLVARAYLRMRDHSRRRRAAAAGGVADAPAPAQHAISRVKVRPIPTVIVGAVGGLIVGMTSVGSGSLIIVALLALYPMLRTNDLVGTDLVQAVPLVASAALGHLLYGEFQFNVTTSLLLGCIPGVFLGAQVSARAQGGFVRRALAIVLLASSLKLLYASNTQLVIGVAAAVVLGPLVWAWLRTRNGLPALGRAERAPRAAETVADPTPVGT
ncbi:MAG TPA: sulfite exporter TauE/SafE family protein [Micromonosporaceae bacterium]|nr:sulfite exporter TauE/SafE family protein [Micromonosporaceae bacterium]